MSLQQRAKLKALLLSRRGEWITAAEIAEVGGLQYGARLFELRHEENLQIESRTERVRTGTGRHSIIKRSWFRLSTDRQAIAAKIGAGEPVTREQIERSQKDDSPTLFDMSEFGAHRDEG